MTTSRPSGCCGIVRATAALTLVLAPTPGPADTLNSSLSVQVEVVERCSAMVAAGRLRLAGCAGAFETMASRQPIAADSGIDAASHPAEREVVRSARIRYLTVIY